MKRYFIRTVLLAVLLLGLGYYEGRYRPFALARRLPTGSAEWIWPADLDSDDGWVNSFLYRDFELGESVPAGANLAIKADGGYWAFVNHQVVGSGSFREHAPTDSYEVGRFLRPGTNRLLVQVRSRRGVGGLIAKLDLGEQESVVTDGSWRTSRYYEKALLDGGFVPADGNGVTTWGMPPVGAWTVGTDIVRVPVLGDQLLRVQTAGVARIRALGGDWEKRFPSPQDRSPLGQWVIFDLGRVARGYLNVVFVAQTGSNGLVYTSLDRPTGPDRAEPATFFSSPLGRGSWTDLEPREFRYVTVLAVSEIAGLRVYETSPEWFEERGTGETRSVTAFEFEPPSTATVENEFRRELERVSGLTGREAFQSGLGG